MNVTTDVTIISTNLNKKLLDNYKDYYLIDSSFNIEDLLLKDKIIFFNALNRFNEEKIKEILSTLKEHNIAYINVTNNIEEALFTSYLIVYDKEKILIEGSTMKVLQEEKLLKRIGLELPFMVELSLLLKDYDLVKQIYLDKESLVKDLWK